MIEKGLTIEFDIFGTTGNYIQTKTEVRPEVKIAHDSLNQVRMFCAEFGLSPSSRAKMQVPGRVPEEDEMEKALGRRMGRAKN